MRLRVLIDETKLPVFSAPREQGRRRAADFAPCPCAVVTRFTMSRRKTERTRSFAARLREGRGRLRDAMRNLRVGSRDGGHAKANCRCS